jgi:hypothetical protein
MMRERSGHDINPESLLLCILLKHQIKSKMRLSFPF